MRRGRVRPTRHAFRHRYHCLWAHRRGGGVIEVDAGQDQFQLRKGARSLYSVDNPALHPSAYPSSRVPMPEVIFPGPEGRLEGRFAPGPRPRAPVAMILHPHPSAGGTMNNAIVQQLYKTFQRRGFATLRFNFRGVGKSQGVFDNGVGELSDAASALDWVQSFHPEAQTTWIAGVSFGAWIGMQLLMRRPEIRGFISVAPPANLYDFTFLAPCPSSGIIIQGEADEVATPGATQKLVDKLRTQKHITIHHDTIPKANHFFEHEMPELMGSVDKYLDMRLDPNSPIR
ncbi:alpha/beta hydrolase [Sphingomonas sp. LR55]|uniref:alpha/beta hydrolase n=1 Tax=Sphingomonas sp. LR55 TaxID=3050231 RepID=UPI002FE1689C